MEPWTQIYKKLIYEQRQKVIFSHSEIFLKTCLLIMKNLFTKYPPGQDIMLIPGNTGKNFTAIVLKFIIYWKDSYAKTTVTQHKKSQKAKWEMKQSEMKPGFER